MTGTRVRHRLGSCIDKTLGLRVNPSMLVINMTIFKLISMETDPLFLQDLLYHSRTVTHLEADQHEHSVLAIGVNSPAQRPTVAMLFQVAWATAFSAF